jgi:hypothetical protein
MGQAVRTPWEISKDAYVRYVDEHDGNMPPQTGPYASLGRWTVNQRSSKHTMSDKHRLALDAIGFCWDPKGSEWSRMYDKLEAHVAKHRAKPAKKTDEVLCKWLKQQVRNRAKLSESQVRKLEEILPGIFPAPAKAHHITTLGELARGQASITFFTWSAKSGRNPGAWVSQNDRRT